MPHYLMLTKLTELGRKTVREHPERVEEVNREVERMVQGEDKSAHIRKHNPHLALDKPA